MDFLTPFVRILLSYRVRAIARYATKAEAIQRKTLAYMVKTSSLIGPAWKNYSRPASCI